jgi:hypothetical protein
MGTVKESEQGLSLVTIDPSNDIPNMVTGAPLKTKHNFTIILSLPQSQEKK